MATKIRLQRGGRKGYAFFRVVVADSRTPRDGRFIEKLGYYNPNTNPSTVVINFERALYWVEVGAKPTDTVKNILQKEGVYLMKHLRGGVKKGAFDEAESQNKFKAWKQAKEKSVKAIVDKAKKAREESAAKVLENEKKINEEIAKRVASKKAEAIVAQAEEAIAEAEESVELAYEQVEASTKSTMETPVEEMTEVIAEESPVTVVEEPAETPAEGFVDELTSSVQENSTEPELETSTDEVAIPVSEVAEEISTEKVTRIAESSEEQVGSAEEGMVRDVEEDNTVTTTEE